MKKDTGKALSLSVWTDMGFLPLCTSFVENSALAFGLDANGATALTLAVEEIFSYLCRISGPDRGVTIRSSSRRYYNLVEISCPVHDFDMRLFNLTARVSAEDEASLEQMGLLIASRFVDRLNVTQGPDKGILLSLVKEKSYPKADQSITIQQKELSRFSLSRPQPELIKIITIAVNSLYPPSMFPKAFRYPGKVVDMVEGGEYEAIAATGPDGSVGGALFWRWVSDKTVECFGPYIFGQTRGSAIAEGLLEACIGAIAKSPALGLVSLLPTEELPREHFEDLGTLTLFDEKGGGTRLTAYFRQMHEDPGAYSWCHTELESFLRSQYARLAMPREIIFVKDQGETKNPFSVLSVDIERSANKATIRPVRSGNDMEKNLVGHLDLLRNESIRNLFFVMDLGIPWQTEFTHSLLQSGFSPRVVVPYGGEGDQVIFQLGA
ncbi:MAG: hypothetical protein C4582_03560 [Desulfobacteraceae bacterium]|nr:MAG: hypothetical protein C4582_03560 [Desulfobacteraceae bacterium]